MHTAAHLTLLHICFVIFTGAASANTAAQAETDDIASKYRVLKWQDLVPGDWEPPLISPGHDTNRVPRGAVVVELDEVNVTLPGYLKPVKFENDKVSEFLLVPFLPHHTRQHAHLDANQMVYVLLMEPVSVEKPFDPIWVVGTLFTNTVVTDEGPAAYTISNAVITDYEY